MSELYVNKIYSHTDANNQIEIPSGHSLYAPGHVVQVVQASMGDRLALSTGGNFTAVTGFTASITPKSSNSKILVQCNVNMAGNSSSYAVGARLYHKSGGGSFAHLSDASSSDSTYSNDSGCWFAIGSQTFSNYVREQATNQYLHSPASTAEQTYALYVTDQRDNTTVYINRYHYQANQDYMHTTKSFWTLMEIAQ